MTQHLCCLLAHGQTGVAFDQLPTTRHPAAPGADKATAPIASMAAKRTVSLRFLSSSALPSASAASGEPCLRIMSTAVKRNRSLRSVSCRPTAEPDPADPSGLPPTVLRWPAGAPTHPARCYRRRHRRERQGRLYIQDSAGRRSCAGHVRSRGVLRCYVPRAGRTVSVSRARRSTRTRFIPVLSANGANSSTQRPRPVRVPRLV